MHFYRRIIMKQFLLITLLVSLFASISISTSAQSKPLVLNEPTQKLLLTLDNMVKNKAQYHAKHYERIRQLKALARKAKGYNKYNIYKNIFDLYAHYQTDSAQVYIDAMTRLPEYKRHREYTEPLYRPTSITLLASLRRPLRCCGLM